MSNELDLRVVRDFARRAILTSAEDVDFMGIAEQFGDDEDWPADEDAAERMHEAIDAEAGRATVTVSWPDEQPQDERDALPSQHAAVLLHQFVTDAPADELPEAYRTAARGVLAERAALAARVAELEAHPWIAVDPAQDERDGDVRAVAPCCGGVHAGWIHAADCTGLDARDVAAER